MKRSEIELQVQTDAAKTSSAAKQPIPHHQKQHCEYHAPNKIRKQHHDKHTERHPKQCKPQYSLHYMHPTAVLCLIIRVKNIHDVFFCHLLVLFRKTVHYIRYHIQDLCDRILILDIDQLRSAVLDHDHRAR